MGNKYARVKTRRLARKLLIEELIDLDITKGGLRNKVCYFYSKKGHLKRNYPRKAVEITKGELIITEEGLIINENYT